MSLCQNVIRRGAVYWWRRKIRDRSAITHVFAISLKVREPDLAKRLAALLNVELDKYRAAILSGKLTIDQTRKILAHFIEKERDSLDNSIFHARNTIAGPAPNASAPDPESELIRDQRVLAGAYTLAALYPKGQEADEFFILKWCRDRGFSDEEAYMVTDYLRIRLSTMSQAGAEGFGPSVEYLTKALASVGAAPTQENLDILWRQFLRVRAKALADYPRRHSTDLIGLDELFKASTEARATGTPLKSPTLDFDLIDEERAVSPGGGGPTGLSEPGKGTDTNGSAPPASDEIKLSDKLLSEVSAEFQRKTYEIRNERSAKGENKSASNHAVLIWVLGDRPIKSYTSADISRFEDVYRKLPHDYKNMRQGGKSPTEVIELAAKMRNTLPSIKDPNKRKELEKRLAPLSAKTFNAKIGAFKELLLFAKLPNITEGWHQKVPKSKTAQREERRAPELASVEKLFSGPVWTGRQSKHRVVAPGTVVVRDSLYWIPLLCAHHGIRLDEAAQLRGRHIVRIEGVACFDLKNDPALRLKNGNARRLIPIHRAILELGFDQVIDALEGDAQLFPELTNTNANKSYGESVNKRYGRYLREIFGAEVAKTLTSHCFRHFVSTQLRNSREFKDSWVNELMGHEGERVSEAERYNKGIYVSNLKSMVDSVAVPVDYESLHAAWLASKTTSSERI